MNPIARMQTDIQSRFKMVLLENSCNQTLFMTLLPTDPEKQTPVEVKLHLPTLLPHRLPPLLPKVQRLQPLLKRQKKHCLSSGLHAAI